MTMLRWAISLVVKRAVHIGETVGSIPTSPTKIKLSDFCPPERSVWRAKRAISSAQKRFGLCHIIAPKPDFAVFQTPFRGRLCEPPIDFAPMDPSRSARPRFRRARANWLWQIAKRLQRFAQRGFEFFINIHQYYQKHPVYLGCF